MQYYDYSIRAVQTSAELKALNQLLIETYMEIYQEVQKAHKLSLKSFFEFTCFKDMAGKKTHFLIYKNKAKRPLGTITLYEDEKYLPIEYDLNIHLDDLRAKKYLLCEVGRYATLPGYRNDPKIIVLTFFQVLMHCLSKKIDLLITQVTQPLVGAFRRFGFQSFQGTEQGLTDTTLHIPYYPLFLPLADSLKTAQTNYGDHFFSDFIKANNLSQIQPSNSLSELTKFAENVTVFNS